MLAILQHKTNHQPETPIKFCVYSTPPSQKGINQKEFLGSQCSTFGIFFWILALEPCISAQLPNAYLTITQRFLHEKCI